RDTLVLASTNGGRLDRAVTTAVRTVASSMGREVEVVHRDVGGPDRRVPFVAVAASLVGGFLAATAGAWYRGQTRTLGAGVRRFAWFSALSAVTGVVVLLVALPFGGSPRWAVVAAALVLAASTFTNALASLWGLGGIGLATALFGVTGVSLFSF